MTDLTPEEIQQAREFAEDALQYPNAVRPDDVERLARAVLALAEQQPEPVSHDDLFAFLAGEEVPGEWLSYIADALLSRYTITRKQPEGADHG